jgi:hypothetical protein
MSSLVRKLKVLISTSVRGPRRRERGREAHPGTVEERDSQPEVIEASPSQRKLPEVTEAPQVQEARVHVARSASSAADRVELPKEGEDRIEELEEGRVADLLKDHDSS